MPLSREIDVTDCGVLPDDPGYALANSDALDDLSDAVADAIASDGRRRLIRLPVETVHVDRPWHPPPQFCTVLGAPEVCTRIEQPPYRSGLAIIIGAHRLGRSNPAAFVPLAGLLDPSVTGGYGLDCSILRLHLLGTPFDQGPADATGLRPAFWANVRQLEVRGIVIPQPRGPGRNDILLGTNSQRPTQDRPEPIAIRATDGKLQVRLRDTAGNVHEFALPVALKPGVPLRYRLAVDLDSGRYGGAIDGTAVKVAYTPRPGWGQSGAVVIDKPGWSGAFVGGMGSNFIHVGLKLSDRITYPLDTPVGTRLPPEPDSATTAPLPGRGEFACLGPAPAIADDLPWTGAGFGGHAPLVLASGAQPSPPPTDVTLRWLDLDCGFGGYGSGVAYHACLRFHATDCTFTGGAFGLCNLFGFTSYPTFLERLTLSYHAHAALHLGFGQTACDRIEAIALGRFGISAFHGFDMDRSRFGEGGAVEDVFRSWGLGQDPDRMLIARTATNFERYTPRGRYVRYTPSVKGGTLALDAAAFGLNDGKSPVWVDTPDRAAAVVLSGAAGSYVRGKPGPSLVEVNSPLVSVDRVGPRPTDLPVPDAAYPPTPGTQPPKPQARP